jgi:hypothetical protein
MYEMDELRSPKKVYALVADLPAWKRLRIPPYCIG